MIVCFSSKAKVTDFIHKQQEQQKSLNILFQKHHMIHTHDLNKEFEPSQDT